MLSVHSQSICTLLGSWNVCTVGKVADCGEERLTEKIPSCSEILCFEVVCQTLALHISDSLLLDFELRPKKSNVLSI